MAAVTPEEQFGQILALLGENSKGICELKQSVSEMSFVKAEFDAWKPEVDHRVTELDHAVNYIWEKMEMLFGNQPKHVVFDGGAPIGHSDPDRKSGPGMRAAGSAHLESTLHEASSGLYADRNESIGL